MKDFYQIHEIARLFHLHPDTLRYYEEKGLLHPERERNGYRRYTIQDICTLNVIRSLRELDMPTEDIRHYLKRRSVEGTLELLAQEEKLLEEKLTLLQVAGEEARQRRARLERYRSVPEGKVILSWEEERPYVFLRRDVILEKEVDFLLKKLEEKHQDDIKVIGTQPMGAIIDEESLSKGIYNHFSCVFFLTAPDRPCDAYLPEGSYASLFYRGGYDRQGEHLRTLFEGVREAGFYPGSPVLELYHIDTHDTNREEEYVTQLQIRVGE